MRSAQEARRGVVIQQPAKLAAAILGTALVAGAVAPAVAQAPPSNRSAPSAPSARGPAASAPAASAIATREDYAACQAQNETQFREAIEAVTLKALEASVRGLDYRPIVADAWRKGNVDDIMRASIDAALAELEQETSWSERLSSLAYRETQEKLARAAAERVYGSDEMRRAIEALAVSVGRVVGDRLELATGDAAEPTTRCLEAFLGPRFGATVARIVAKDAGREFAIDASLGTATIQRGTVLMESKEGMAGLVAVIMRRQIGNLSARVGQRLVGAVLGRVVSMVAGGLGVALIAKDVWELRKGILPMIASEMRSPAMRDKVQAELAKSIATEIDAHLRDISRRTSERVIDIWHEFRRAHAKVLELAERNGEFKAFIDNIGPANLARLDEIVALQLASGGEARLLSRVADGSLAEAIERWPAAVLEIARDRRSLEAGFKWRALAGDVLVPKVIEYELHRSANPDDLTRLGLHRILALDDRLAIGHLAPLSRAALEPLLELGDTELKQLARGLGTVELTSLSGYMTALERPAGRRLLTTVAETPSRMRSVAPVDIREAILASRDQTAALQMMLRPGDILDLGDFASDFELVRSGAVSPRLLVARYPLALVGFGVLGLALVMLLWRAVVGRRPGQSREAAET
jgi:hypothetical protein